MPQGASLSWEIPLAAFGHAVIFAVVTLARCSGGEEPLFKPQETIQVALAGPPKNVTRMPQKAERAPDAPRAPDVPKAPDTPPPPNTSDMAFKTPDAPPTKGNPKADLMQKKLDELQRQRALQDLNAPVGTEDRAASNPDGSEEGGPEATAGINDPALAKWQAEVKRRVEANWHPLLATCQANPSLAVQVAVKIDATGAPTETPRVVKSSGNVSIDESARRAVEATGRLPAPPAGYNVTATNSFKCKEVL